MFCENCGAKLADNSKFCQRCGAPVRQEDNVPGQENSGSYSVPPQAPAKKKIRKWPFILAAIILIAAACIIGGILIFQNKNKKNNFAEYLASGQRYLEEMDYEKAEDAYLKAVEIDPKQAEPYLKLADIYVAQNNYEKAEEILKKGSEETDSSEITERYSLYEYTEDVLIPGEGECKEGEYICEYTDGVSIPYLENAESLEGVLTSRIRDFDGDGSEELLVLVLKNEEAGLNYIDYPDDYTCNKVYLRMYERENGEIALKDEILGIYPVLGAGDNEEAGIFLKENSGKTYICGSSHNLIVGGATPSSLMYSFVITYDGNMFTKLAGYDEPVIGTDFYGDPDAEEMADLLDDIGLEGMTSYMRDSYMMIFDFSADEYDEMLMFVTGENDGSGDQTAYYDNLFEGNTIPELLGKVVFTLQLSWDESGDESSGQNSSDVPETPDYLGFFFRSSV